MSIVLPFRLSVPGLDTFDLQGVHSVSARIEGRAAWDGAVLTLEWAETQTIEEVSLLRVRDEQIKQPPLAVDVPASELLGAVVRGGWWRPVVELRPRYFNAFDAIPGAKPGRLELRIARRDRSMARRLVDELDRAIAHHQLPPATDPT